MTPCTAPLPADLPALVAELTASPAAVGAAFRPAHVDVYRARVLGDADRLVVLRAPGRTAVALLHDGCPVWSDAVAGDTLLTVSVVPDVWGERDVLEVRTRVPGAGGASPSVDLRYLAAVDAQVAEVFAVHRDAAFSVHFAREPGGEVVLGVVDPLAPAIALYHRDGDRFAPVPTLTPPAPRAVAARCDALVYGPPASLLGPVLPSFDDPDNGVELPEDLSFVTDRWRMDLSDAPDLDVVVQVRPVGDTGPRATWLFRPVGPETWCRSGPALEGVDLDLPMLHTVAPRYGTLPGVLPGRSVLQAEESAAGAGAASWEGDDTSLWAVVGGELSPIFTVQTHSYGGYGGGGASVTGTWAILPTVADRPAALAVAYDLDQEDRDRCGLGSLSVLRFDGESYVPWYAPLRSTERDYAPDEAVGCRTSTWPTAW